MVLMGGLLSCEKRPGVDIATRDQILVIGNGAEPKALDPHIVSAVGDSNIMRVLFEGLVTFHPSDDSEDAPGVAYDWEPKSEDDATEWTFYLRKDAKWSNGDPVTSADFAYAYSRILHPEMGSPYSSMLYVLVNAEKYAAGEVPFSEVGVKTPDSHTLVLSLNANIPYFPDMVKHTTWLPVHQGTIERFGGMTTPYSPWQRPGNHVGNGAFMLEDWRINAYVKVKPNPHYWDADTVKLKGIHFYPIDNIFTEERAFRDGQIHMTYELPPNFIPVYKEANDPSFRTDPYFGTYFYRCNTTRPPMNDVNFRKALAYAIDRQKIIDYIKQGNERPAYGLTYPIKGYAPPKGLGFDPEKARDFLKKAGYSSGADVPKFSVMINTHESHKAIAVAIQDMWATHLGFSKENVTIKNQEWKVFQQTLQDIDYDVARSGWIGDFIDPTTFLDLMRSDDTNNETGWKNAEYDRLIQEAKQMTDREARNKKLVEAEEIMLNEMPVIPIYWYTRVYLRHPDVKGWHPLLLDNHPVKHVWLERSAAN